MSGPGGAGLDRRLGTGDAVVVGLGAMVENVLGLRLEKGHSAADWSTRPLPESWLVYAALDVEVLVELRDRLEQVLREQGKLELAAEEFEAVRSAPAPAPRVDPLDPAADLLAGGRGGAGAVAPVRESEPHRPRGRLLGQRAEVYR